MKLGLLEEATGAVYHALAHPTNKGQQREQPYLPVLKESVILGAL